MEDTLLYFALKYEGDFDLIYHALIQKEVIDYEYFKQLKKDMKCQYTTLVSEDYPTCLKEIGQPPFVLFYYGDLSLVNENTIAMVGMRNPSEYGKNSAISISKFLAKHNQVVVSGLAKGIDTYCHIGAIDQKGKTIAVLGSGIDYCYPSRNFLIYEIIKKDHLIVSEYPGMTKPHRKYFPARNRIVVGLSQKLVVVEAKRKSGTMISVGFALEQGKEIYCVPSRLDDHDGCNYLISQGAHLLCDFNELI